MTLEQYIQNLNSAIFSADTNDLVSTNLPDFNHESIVTFSKKINLDFIPKKENGNVCFANNNDELRDDFKQVFDTTDFLNYIYAVSFSAIFKEKVQKSFTKDFPEIPFPKVDDDFWKLVKLGREMREINLLESPCLEGNIAQFPADGNNMVHNLRFKIKDTTPAYSHPSKGGEFTNSNSPPLEGCPPQADGVVNNTTPPHFTIKNIKIFHNTITTLPYNPKLKERAKALRYAYNLSEVLFWMQVHKSHFYKIDFDRQRIIGNYIVDFYVKKLGLVVEIDGSSHEGKEKHDAERENYLKSFGLKTYRIPVIDVLENMSKTMTDLENFIIENYGEIDCDEIEIPPCPPAADTPAEHGNCIEGNCSDENLVKVFINHTQYFVNIPEAVWNLYIGNSQPAQKWLTDRKSKLLESKDIKQYQRIIATLIVANRIIQQINNFEIQ
ncbi:type ISP restriction/modification enzyme [Flavobacterium weaverense]|uniref:Very-short-patch-repair endonuclease n=1 Tax=Flavobacterium weaverense TaxID=271156 RepID=A0A3M0A1Q5_9FLAO|nr:type ISP restriction/modification enzyme [Flavobacterium weaverense]RMA77379.1 very-short-patch-repair endonuclease [Flavobacterium weaverense]